MNVAIFLDPVAILLVFGGAMLMAAMRSTRRDLARAVAALRPLLRVNVEAEAQAARVAVNRIAERTAQGGLATADRAPLVERFLARAAVKLSDSRDPGAFAAWGETELAMRAERHAAVHAVWRAAADAAPAMGMIGTVMGLVAMFAAMNDPAAMGPGMAIAMLTTLYGLVLAFAICGPVAARLQRLSDAECAWQARTVERLVALARAEEDEVLGGIRRFRRAG